MKEMTHEGVRYVTAKGVGCDECAFRRPCGSVADNMCNLCGLLCEVWKRAKQPSSAVEKKAELTQKLTTETNLAWTYRVEGGDVEYSEDISVWGEWKDFPDALKSYTRCPYRWKSLVRVVEVAI